MPMLPRAIMLVLVVVLLAATPAASRQGPSQPPISQAWLAAQRAALAQALPAGAAIAVAPPARVRVLLELADLPVAPVYAASLRQHQRAFAAAHAGRSQLARVEQAQQRLLSRLQPLGTTPIYRVQRVLNAVAVELDHLQLAQVRSWPGVVRVSLLRPKYRGNADSVPLIGAPGVWASGPGGTTGAGVTIGIIDTGIDYTHAGLGGSGLASDFGNNNALLITDTGTLNNFGSGKKVRGGYDFAGDQYAADCSVADQAAGLCSSQPQPDLDPLDNCDGHGSHVAGTAAGNGILNNGAAYAGPYNAGLNFDQFRVGPGVAPQATLYAIRVFGCGGSSDLVEQGIEWAVDPNGDGDLSDHLDIINMSLGGAFGGPTDPTALASNNAALAGVVVVAAAGNSGDTYYINDSPGVADWAISVAASVAGDNPELVDTVPSFSSRGPRRGDSFLKPDLAAPGQQIASVGRGTGNGARTLSGTSMATPHVAGMLALLRQLHPTWTVEELKALAINTATQDLFDPDAAPLTYGPGRIGTGRVVMGQAATSNVVAYNAANAGLVSLSFGRVDAGTGVATMSKPLRVVNKGTTAQTIEASYLPRITMEGVEVALSSAGPLELAAGASALLTVTITANAALMAYDGRDPSVPAFSGTLARHWLDEVAGYVQLTAAANPPIRVPVHAAPRRSSAMAAVPEQFSFAAAPDAQATLGLAGSPITTDGIATSLLSAFELQEVSVQSTEGYSRSADLAYVGVSSNFSGTTSMASPAAVLAEATLAFGIATHGEWTVPHSCDTEFRIYIDTDGSAIQEDGTGAEFMLINTSTGDAAGRGCRSSDTFVTGLYEIRGGVLVGFEYTNLLPAGFNTAIYNNDVLVMPVSVGRLGLSASNTRINYRVVSSIGGLGVVDSSSTHGFDLANPGITFAETLVGPLHRDAPGEMIAFRYERQAYLGNDSKGMLLLHHHNRAGTRAQAVDISVTNRPLYLPIVYPPR